MDRLVYTALSGLRSNMVAQDITAHNIANASTPGFKRDIGASQSRDLAGPSFTSRIQVAEGVLASEMDPGPIAATGRSLDVAMREKAMLAVQASDGKEVYTRRGDLRVGSTGVLETGDGLPVLDDSGGPITVPPATRMEIGADGTISIQPQGSDAKDITQVGRLKMVTPTGPLVKRLDGLLAPKDGKPLAADDAARLDTGSLEGSNVNIMSSMVDMIEQARSYEVQVQMISSMKEIDQNSTQLLRVDN